LRTGYVYVVSREQGASTPYVTSSYGYILVHFVLLSREFVPYATLITLNKEGNPFSVTGYYSVRNTSRDRRTNTCGAMPRSPRDIRLRPQQILRLQSQ
jgi:hypothetical protein